MDIEKSVHFSQSVFSQEVDGEMVLLDMNSENYFGLDAVGTVIWQAMQEHKKLGDVLNFLIEYYEIDEEILKNDLLQFVENLEKSGLITILNEEC